MSLEAKVANRLLGGKAGGESHIAKNETRVAVKSCNIRFSAKLYSFILI